MKYWRLFHVELVNTSGRYFNCEAFQFDFEFSMLMLGTGIVSGFSWHMISYLRSLHSSVRKLGVSLLFYSVCSLSQKRWIVHFYIFEPTRNCFEKSVYFLYFYGSSVTLRNSKISQTVVTRVLRFEIIMILQALT